MDNSQLIDELTQIVIITISDRVDISNCDMEKMCQGIKKFIHNNGYDLVIGKLDREVVEEFVRKSTCIIVDDYGQNCRLYFENYELIENFRIIVNTIHNKMLREFHGEKVYSGEVISLRDRINEALSAITKISGLREFLSLQISEGLEDLDRLEGKTTGMSIRSIDDRQKE